jgi:hypothetical protein
MDGLLCNERAKVYNKASQPLCSKSKEVRLLELNELNEKASQLICSKSKEAQQRLIVMMHNKCVVVRLFLNARQQFCPLYTIVGVTYQNFLTCVARSESSLKKQKSAEYPSTMKMLKISRKNSVRVRVRVRGGLGLGLGLGLG